MFATMSLTLGLLALGARMSFGQIVHVDAEAAKAFEQTPKSAVEDTPVVMMHGIFDFANNQHGMVQLRSIIARIVNAYVHNVELCSDHGSSTKLSDCSSEDLDNSLLMPMDDQVDQFARVVSANSQFNDGFNAIGFSTGSTVIRGYIHRYNNPPVKTFVSIHGPMMGVSGLPPCPTSSRLEAICRPIVSMVKRYAYYEYMQNRFPMANYFRDPTDLSNYRSYCHFLPFINNEVPGKENARYAANFRSLKKLVLVKAENDTMVVPKESEHFGYFKDGSVDELISMKDAPWYKEDWFGLRTLDEANKVDFFSTPGDHMRFELEFIATIVRKYFVSNATYDVVV